VKTHRYAWILPVASALVVSLLVLRSHSRAAAQAAALSDARRVNLGLQHLKEENKDLKSAELSDEERRKRAAVRAETEALRARLAALEGGATAHADANEGPNEVSAKDWTNAGRLTPRAAIESVLWAASRGDVDHLAALLGFQPEVREQVDAMFAKLPEASQRDFGTAENVIATMLAGSFPKDASSMTILADKQWGEDAGIAMTVDHEDGKSRTSQFRLHHTPDGWQLMVPASVIEGYQQTLTGDSQPAAAGQQ
jgi:hypothetical protein